MEAPWKDQLALLDLQELDTKIARLRFRLKKMPQLVQLAELSEKDRKLDDKHTQLSALKTDKQREITSLENDLTSIQNRLHTQQERLDAGAGTPKELVSLQDEIQQMHQRIDDLEEQMLTLMGELEQVRGQTGGVGAVKVVDGRPVGYDLAFSVAEIAHLRAAKPEEIITSEDEGYLLIRCPQ